MMTSKFGMQLYDTFTVVLLKYFPSSFPLKCLSIKDRNTAATLVLIVSLKVGLNQVIFVCAVVFSFALNLCYDNKEFP